MVATKRALPPARCGNHPASALDDGRWRTDTKI